MEFDDRLKAEIEMMAKALRAALERAIQLRESGQSTEALATLEKETKEIAQLDIAELQTIQDEEELIHFLEMHSNVKEDHFETVSTLLLEYADSPYLTQPLRTQVLLNGIHLLDYLAEKSGNWSYDRNLLKQKLKDKLQDRKQEADDH